MLTADQIIQRIQESLPSAQIRAVDMTGGGDHWQVTIRAGEFKGKSLIEQHQLVYAALGELMSGPIHALKLETKEG